MASVTGEFALFYESNNAIGVFRFCPVSCLC